MIFRRMAMAACGVLLASAISWAAVCPLCGMETVGGAKYCPRHTAEMAAKQINSKDEQKLVDEVDKARADYVAKLQALEKFYESRGNAERRAKVQGELKDQKEGRKFEYVGWEERLPELSASEVSPTANKLLKEADAMRGEINWRFNRGSRYKLAAQKYQEILVKYPKSAAVDSAAFGLGEIYSSRTVAEYPRAVRLYELAYLANPKTEHEALFRAAQVCDSDLSQYENAARFYWMAAKNSKSAITRKRASLRLTALQKKDFGLAYSLEEKAPAAEKAAPKAAK